MRLGIIKQACFCAWLSLSLYHHSWFDILPDYHMDNTENTDFKQFYNTYYRRCFLFARSYVHDDWVAEDISSGALVKLWEMSQEKTIDNPKIILFTILRNKALDYLKHQSIKENTLSVLSEYGKRELEIRISTLEATNPDKIFASDIQRIIKETLAKLPEQTRKVFEMNRFQNLSKKEIGEELGISIKGVDYHISKALKCLKENLQDYFPIILFLFF